MHTQMNHKIFEGWISSVCGVFGFGITWTNVMWSDALPKIALSMVSAALAGGMGYLGKLATVWSIRKFKAFIHRIKNRK